MPVESVKAAGLVAGLDLGAAEAVFAVGHDPPAVAVVLWCPIRC